MSLKIVYLDDEPALLEMFGDLFSSPDREIALYDNPKTAIAAIEADPPDILFIDFRLPGYTGDQIAQLLDPKIPKVLITGDMEVKCAYPFHAVFEKPYTSKLGEIEALLNALKLPHLNGDE